MYQPIEQVDLDRVKRDSARQRNINEIRRCQIRELKANPYQECKHVLEAIITHCEKRQVKQMAKKEEECPLQTKPVSVCPNKTDECNDNAPCPPTNKGAGCSTGMCGGYTPSGWNKANAHKGAEVSDCLPPRTPVPPCPLRGGGEENQGQQEGQDAVISGEMGTHEKSQIGSRVDFLNQKVDASTIYYYKRIDFEFDFNC